VTTVPADGRQLDPDRGRYFQPAAFDSQVFPGSPINVFSTIRFRFN